MFNVKYGKPKRIHIDGVEEVAFVTFKYEKAIVDFIKTLTPHFWHPEEKEWEITKKSLKELEKEYGGQVVGIAEEDKFWKETVEDYLEEGQIPTDYKGFKLEPKPHQYKFIKKAINNDAVLNASQIGTGKTNSAIHTACIRKHLGQIKKCFVICGVAIVASNWKKEEIPKHCNEKGYILGTRISTRGENKGRLKKHISINDKIEDLEKIDEIEEFFLITNIETLRNIEFATKFKEICEKEDIMVIVDESHKAKGAESEQGTGLLSLNPKYRMLISATPAPKDTSDLYVPLKWCGQFNGEFEDFKKKFCVEKVIKKEFPDRWRKGKTYIKEIPKIVGSRNVPELRELLKHCMVRELKKNVLKDLPPVTYQRILVDMNDEERKVYDQVRGELKEHKEELLLKCTEQNELTRLRQVTGYAKMLNPDIKHCSKMDKMVEMVKELVDDGEKVLIYSYFTQITRVAKEVLKEYNPAYVTGEIEANERQEQIDKFKNDDSCKVIIGTIGALGISVTLTNCCNAIFIDEGKYSYAEKQQSSERIYRMGQTKPCFIYTLQCANTIDEKVGEVIESKKALSSQVLDGGESDENEGTKIQKMSRGDFFDYLLEEE